MYNDDNWYNMVIVHIVPYTTIMSTKPIASIEYTVCIQGFHYY